MGTFYIIKLEVDSDPRLNEALVVFDDDPAAVEQEARRAARSMLRPGGTEVVWSYYGPFNCPTDRVTESVNFGVE